MNDNIKTREMKAIEIIKMILNEPIKLRREASDTEHRVVRLAARAYTNEEIAQELKIDASLVAYYLRSIKERYGITKAEITKRMLERIEAVLELSEN